MRNFLQAGSNLTIPAPAITAPGDVVIAGAIIGVAAGAAASGAPLDVVTTGVFELPKVGANAFALGALVYWDSTAKLATSTSASNTLIGVAVAAAGASTPTARVRLSGF